MLEAKIKDIKATKSSQNDTIQACKTVIDSNTYPKLNPIISSFSAHLEKLDKKKDKKIVKKENQLKKAQRKLVKLQRKQKEVNFLKTSFRLWFIVLQISRKHILTLCKL